jgi:aminomethyltransferase
MSTRALESGGYILHPPKGSGADSRLISQVTGQRGGRCSSTCRLFLFADSTGCETGEPVPRRTCLFELHQELGARIVDFGGWDMPVQYSSQLEEHHAVRRAAGVFDVSHMCVIDLKGDGARPFLRRLLANDVSKLQLAGKALYSCMLNAAGGVLDDLIVYFLSESWFRAVVNAGTRDKDLAWIRHHAQQFGVDVIERTDLAILAVQGPNARATTANLLSAQGAEAALALRPFFGRDIDGWFIARTGYTGEDGFEIMLPAAAAAAIWRDLNALGVRSC